MSVIWQAILAFLTSFLRGWFADHEKEVKQQEVDNAQANINALSDDDVSKQLFTKYER